MRKTTQIRTAIALLSSIALVIPVVSLAQQADIGGVSIDRFMNAIAKSEVRPKNLQRALEPRHGVLTSRAIIDIPLNLSRGSGYGFVAVGDDNANDVDLHILDERNNRITEDNDTDDTAVAIFTPKRAGRYRARVIMFGCQADQCEYALGVYKGSNLSRRP